MGRNLLKAPLAILLAQTAETRIHLRDLHAVRAGLVAAGIDLGAIEAELDRAFREGETAAVATFAVRDELRLVAAVQTRVNEGFRQWVSSLRLRLQMAEASGEPDRIGSAALLRRLIPPHPGRRFAATLEALRGLAPELRGRARLLDVERWSEQLLGEAESWLASAEAAAEEARPLLVRRGECSREQVRTAEQLARMLRGLRAAWALARTHDRHIPEMTLYRLEEWVAHAAEATSDDATEAP